MTATLSVAAAVFAPTTADEPGATPASTESADFGSFLSGLEGHSNAGGEPGGEAETEARSHDSRAAEPDSATAPPTDALLLASISQLWLPPTPQPPTETTPTTADSSSGEIDLEAAQLRTGADFVRQPVPLSLGTGESSSDLQLSATGEVPLLTASSGQLSQSEIPAVTRQAGSEADDSVGLEARTAASALPSRTFVSSMASFKEQPLASSSVQSLPEATVVAASTAAVSPQSESSEPRTPLVRRFTSAAEMLFAAAEEPSGGAAPSTGTGTAEQGGGMKQGTDQKQFAESGAQALPPELAAAAPARRGGARSVPEDGGVPPSRMDVNTAFGSLPMLPPSGYFGLEELSEFSAPRGVGTQSVPELTQAGVMRHVTELRYSGATELAVVLKPDADTRIALRLTFNSNGEVSVQARCEQGDAQGLAANWGDLRHALAQHGVRLGALDLAPELKPENLTPRTGNGGPSPDGQPSSQRHGQPWPETLDDLPLVGSQTESPSRRGPQRLPAGRGRRWESWA